MIYDFLVCSAGTIQPVDLSFTYQLLGSDLELHSVDSSSHPSTNGDLVPLCFTERENLMLM